MGMYVIQVVAGKEAHVIHLIERYIKPGLITECFSTKREVLRREGGTWQKCEENLLPGYLFVSCDDPSRVADCLKRIPAFTRMLGNDDVFIPLSDDEVRWLSRLTTSEERIIRMSRGVIEEGGKVVVTEGPLRGYEANIKRIDRHKRVAWLEMRILGRTKSVKVGLEIVAKAE